MPYRVYLFLNRMKLTGFRNYSPKADMPDFRGNVENDSYSGEIQFKVSGGFPADKPANRQDNASLKE